MKKGRDVIVRTGENIYKRKDGRWEARFIYQVDAEGKSKYRSVYGKSRQIAKDKREALKLKFMMGEVCTSPVIVFRELAKNWLNNTKLRIKESTYSRYCNQVEKHILPHFGKYQASKISTELIEKFVERLGASKQDGGFGLSPKTVEDILIIIKSMFRFGKCHAHLELHRIKIKKDYKRPRTLPKLAQAKLNQHLLHDPNNEKAGILLGQLMGVRLGEICALQWKDFDLDAGTVHIERTVQRIQVSPEGNNGKKTKVVTTSAKSENSIRDLDIPSPLTAILRKMKMNPDCYLLTGSTKLMEPRSLHNHFKKCLEQSGAGDYNFHCLRHTFATKYIERGYDVKSLSEILGHSNVKITLERYVHSSNELKRNNIEELSGAFLFYSPSELPSRQYAQAL